MSDIESKTANPNSEGSPEEKFLLQGGESLPDIGSSSQTHAGSSHRVKHFFFPATVDNHTSAMITEPLDCYTKGSHTKGEIAEALSKVHRTCSLLNSASEHIIDADENATSDQPGTGPYDCLAGDPAWLQMAKALAASETCAVNKETLANLSNKTLRHAAETAKKLHKDGLAGSFDIMNDLWDIHHLLEDREYSLCL